MRTLLHVAPDYLWVNLYIPSGQRLKCRNLAKLSNTPANLQSLYALFPQIRTTDSAAVTA